MNEKLAQALGYIDDGYISEAAKRKKRKHRFLAAIAAMLALVLFWQTPTIPLAVSAKAVSLAPESRKGERPKSNSDAFKVWYEAQEQRRNTVQELLPAIGDFASECSAEVLSGVDDTNRLWSPINAYIALAMAAELTAGETQQEVLDVLGASGTEQLRAGVSAVWEQIYQNDGREISVLANSVWLDEEMQYHQEAMDDLAYYYYASVYQGDLGSEKTNRAIAAWLNNETGGFLKDRTGKVDLIPNSVMALYSTIYFQSQWCEQFSAGQNTQGVFHANSGDTSCTFMNQKEMQMNYCWGEDFGAVAMHLESGGYMWLILPDEDKTVDDVLESGAYFQMLYYGDGWQYENSKYMKVNLSVPKFDISGTTDLKAGLQNMGLTKIFQMEGNDFSPSVDSELPVYLDSINQDTRVTIDEEGVTAASYIELNFGAGAAMPPEEIIDFTLDRPFVFVITSGYGVPLFMGTVNQP